MMNKRPITFMEGYRAMRAVKADVLSSVFMAFVWLVRGDEIYGD